MADGDLKWTYTTGGDANNQTPVIDSRGVTYVYPEGSILYAIKPDGSLLWSRNVGVNQPQSSGNVFVDYNGSIYVMNKAGLVTALYPDNTVMWTYDTTELSYGKVSVDKNGIVYAISITKITAINPDGTMKWDVTYNSGTFYTAASIDNDSNVYASQWGYGTVCIDSDGNEKWKREFWNDDIIDPYATPSISADGNTIYVSGETHNSNNVLLALDASDGTTNWAFEIVSVFTRTSYSTPAIDDDGIIYIGFNDNTVRAINPNGTEKWSITISAEGVAHYSSPTIALDGTVYFIDYKTLYALDPSNGSEIWSYIAADTAIYTSPAVAQDGTVYFCSKDRKLYAIEASSPPLKDYRDYYTGIDQCYPSLWRNQVDLYQQWVTSKLGVGILPHILSPVINRDGITYIGGYDDKKLYAFNVDGSEKWNYIADEYIYTPPSIDNNNNVYIGTKNGHVYKIDSNGNLVWRFDTDSSADVWMQPSIDNDGVVYIGDEYGIFYAINSDGTEKWRYDTPGIDGMFTHAAALSLSGFVCFGNYNNYIYALNMSDGSEIWRYDTGDDIDSSPVIDSDDVVYIGSYDGVVHAINTDGTNRWTYNIGDNIFMSNAVLSSDESVLYIGAYDDVLYAINTNDGSLKWSYTCLHNIYSTANIRIDEKIYIVDSRYLYILNPDDGSLIWRYYICDVSLLCSYNQYGIALARDGTIYIPIRRGYMYAILNTDLDISLPLHNRKDYFDGNINFSAGISFNQSPLIYIISGNVKDNKGYNINGVNIVFIDDTSYETITDSDGNYSQEVDPDEYNVAASLTGYLPDSADVDASSSDQTQDFTLDRTTVRDKGIRLGSRYLLGDIVDN